jgi:hypothetical protein
LQPAGILVAGVVIDQTLKAIAVQNSDVALFHLDQAVFDKF